MNIFVGNLSFDADEGDVLKLFEGFGKVASVAIVTRREKRGPKSRGFGFVQMPDEQQALAAIAALNGKEFMWRVLDVSPARSKVGAQAKSGLRQQRQSEATVEVRQHPREKKIWFNPAFNNQPALSVPRHKGLPGAPLSAAEGRVRPSGQPGTYKGGRRTRSYMKRRGLIGMQEEAKPRRRIQDNPMRWRKKKDQAKPWQKSPGEHKPWKKTEGARKKAEGEFKPWGKGNRRPQKSRFKGSKNPAGYKR